MIKHKYKIIALVLVLLFITIIYFNKRTTLNISNKDYQVYLDGKVTSAFPSKGDYVAKVQCENATGYWDYDSWSLIINDTITTETNCSVYFTKVNNKVKLTDYIKSIANTEQGKGKVIHETFTSNNKIIDTGYRYEGKNPNNYIKFNNELWRIIGAIETNLANGEKQYLTKIIRENPIGAFVYNKENDNTWENNSNTKGYLNKLLNSYYYNSTNGTSDDACVGSINLDNNVTTKTNCDWTSRGIKKDYRNMIENVIWNLGSVSSTSEDENYYVTNANTWYKYENQNNNLNTNSKNNTTGYVGLLYPSDYGLAVLASSCTRSTNLTDYNSNSCAANNWLYSNGREWTLTSNSSNITSAFTISAAGSISSSTIVTGNIARPVVYLNQNVYITAGNGSRNNPYIIKM